MNRVVFPASFNFIFARLHAKLGEEDEAVKLYNRFIAQAESSEVKAD